MADGAQRTTGERTSWLGAWAPLANRLVRYRRSIGSGLFLLVVTNAIDKTIPWLLKDALDGLVAADLGRVARVAALVLVCALAVALVRTASRIKIFNVGRDVEFDLRQAVLEQLQRLGPSFFQRMSTGETMSRAINDMGQVRALIGFGMLNAANSVVAYTIALAFMLSMSVELTVMAVLPYPLLILCSRMLGSRMFRYSQAAQEALGQLASRVQETLSGIRIVRAFAGEAEQVARFEEANDNALKHNMKLVTIRGLMWPFLLGVGSIGSLLVLWRGTAMVEAGELTPGGLLAFLVYGESLRWPTMGLGYLLAIVQRGRASYGRIAEILNASPEVVEHPHARPPRKEGALEVRNLSYSIGARKVLDDVAFAVPAGSSLAIVGRTASGKSTLAALLSRLLATPAGTVFLDGDDVTELQLRPLRRRIGYAQQEPFLFSSTVARNVGYLFEDPFEPESLEKIRGAAAEASVLEEIEGLPQGFRTVVGERGVQLSGGQKQRIALARALLSEPSVLVMDDPLSAVDAQTEVKILDALDRARRGRTLILITNRVAAAARCDHVIVLDGGRVVQRGTHATLAKGDGLYASLAARQQREQELASLVSSEAE
jgi:ATP-binding cassette subfamily B multidrug efflux pump